MWTASRWQRKTTNMLSRNISYTLGIKMRPWILTLEGDFKKCYKMPLTEISQGRRPSTVMTSFMWGAGGAVLANNGELLNEHRAPTSLPPLLMSIGICTASKQYPWRTNIVSESMVWIGGWGLWTNPQPPQSHFCRGVLRLGSGESSETAQVLNITQRHT